MNKINSLVMEGNISSEPSLKKTLNGSTVCMFTVETNGDNFHVESWGNLATTCAKYCTTGRGIRLVGRLKNVRWKEMEKVVVVAEHIDFK